MKPCGLLKKFSVSRETIRKYRIINKNLYYLNNELELSGYYGYDAQWVRIDPKKWYYRLVLLDTINKMPVAELISENEDAETVKKFINESIPYNKRKAIVTDLKSEYDKIMRELGFVHQHCTFHLKLNINKNIHKFIMKTKIKLKKEYKKN